MLACMMHDNGPSHHSLRLQEALKAIPDQVLDAPPPQLDVLPAFSLPQTLPPSHSTSGSVRSGVSSLDAAVAPSLLAYAAHIHEEQPQAARLGASAGITDMRETSAAQRQAEHTAAMCVSASAGEGTAESQRLCLDSGAAVDVPLAGAAEDQSDVARGDRHEVESESTLEQGLQHAQKGDAGVHSALEQHCEQAGRHSTLLEKGRVLVSA